MTEQLFVFGTLRERGGAGRAIRNLGGVFTEPAFLSGYEMWIQGLIPYVQPAQNGHPDIVRGDLVQFADSDVQAALWQLDTYEGYNADHEDWCRYLRRKVTVQAENAGLVKAWCYVSNWIHVRPYKDSGWTKVPDGDYVQFMMSEQAY